MKCYLGNPANVYCAGKETDFRKRTARNKIIESKQTIKFLMEQWRTTESTSTRQRTTMSGGYKKIAGKMGTGRVGDGGCTDSDVMMIR